MRACLIPLRVEVREPAKNLRRLEQKLADVALYRPDLVCLPECALTGYLYTKEDQQQFAEPIPGPTTEKIAKLADKNDCYICFGLLEATSRGVYSSAVLVDRAGEPRLVQRKLSEQPPFVRGDSVEVAETELGRIAILICGDLFETEVRARLSGPVDIVIAPLARGFDEQSPDLTRWLRDERQAYLNEARKIGALTLLVNALEEAAPGSSFGGALAVSAAGELLAESPHGTDEVLMLETVSSFRGGDYHVAPAGFGPAAAAGGSSAEKAERSHAGRACQRIRKRMNG